MCHSQADSASTMERVTELEEQLHSVQQEKDLLNELLEKSKVCVVSSELIILCERISYLRCTCTCRC